MASGHVNRVKKAEYMAAPMRNVKKALANPEPSTHGWLANLGRSSFSLISPKVD
jgi:hypothetical protein